MAKKEVETHEEVHGEKSILPLKYVDMMEDVFHAVLAIALLGIGIGAFFYSIKRLIETAPFFPNGMIQGVNDILFIVIILEILWAHRLPCRQARAMWHLSARFTRWA
jgi:hypothetical protein